MTDIEKELKKRKEPAKKQKFVETRKAFKGIVRSLAKKYGQPDVVVENTIRERGINYTLQMLERAPPNPSLLERIKKALRLWSRR
jgi:predicted protein tyrosine phosphatase